ncbi:MAG: hypothetical protein H3Z53_07525 [archaeon]|nr:hypothetical protein [archaeon]MCP8314202.1 hypothetical protein [archaeon]MCP8322028.1 hypothetical protein [archaeon]
MKLNPIGIIGGIILIISPFLAWISAFIFNPSLLNLAIGFDILGTPVPGDYVALIVLILLIVGGIVSFFKGLIGGIIGLIGMIIFTAYVFVTPTAGIPIGMILSFLGIGYYLGWIGSIVSIASIIYKPRAAPPPPAPPPPPP